MADRPSDKQPVIKHNDKQALIKGQSAQPPVDKQTVIVENDKQTVMDGVDEQSVIPDNHKRTVMEEHKHDVISEDKHSVMEGPPRGGMGIDGQAGGGQCPTHTGQRIKEPYRPKLRQDGEPYASSTGGPGHREVDQTNWRVKMQKGRIKFDDDAKRRFLEAFAESNRMHHSALASGVTYLTVQHHIKIDPEFATAVEEAKQQYRDRLLEQSHMLIFEGVDEPIVGGKDKNEVVAFKRRYSEGLLQMELRRMDPDYKERREVENKGGGGVLVVPGKQSAEDWIKSQEQRNAERDSAPAEEGGAQ